MLPYQDRRVSGRPWRGVRYIHLLYHVRTSTLYPETRGYWGLGASRESAEVGMNLIATNQGMVVLIVSQQDRCRGLPIPK